MITDLSGYLYIATIYTVTNKIEATF